MCSQTSQGRRFPSPTVPHSPVNSLTKPLYIYGAHVGWNHMCIISTSGWNLSIFRLSALVAAELFLYTTYDWSRAKALGLVHYVYDKTRLGHTV